MRAGLGVGQGQGLASPLQVDRIWAALLRLVAQTLEFRLWLRPVGSLVSGKAPFELNERGLPLALSM